MTDDGIVEQFDFASIKKIDDLKAIDKATMLVITRGDNQTLSLGLGKIDVSNTSNFSQMTSFAMGTQGKFLPLTDYTQRLAFTCVEQN